MDVVPKKPKPLIHTDGIPGAKYPHAFAWVCGMLLVLFVVMYIDFRRKRWI